MGRGWAAGGALFDSGGVLMRPIGGRWNPRADFEETVLGHDPTVTPERFAAAISAGKAVWVRVLR